MGSFRWLGCQLGAESVGHDLAENHPPHSFAIEAVNGRGLQDQRHTFLRLRDNTLPECYAWQEYGAPQRGVGEAVPLVSSSMKGCQRTTCEPHTGPVAGVT